MSDEKENCQGKNVFFCGLLYEFGYAIIFRDLNKEEDKNIKEIIEEKKYLKLIGPEKCFNCSREMLLFQRNELFSFQLFLKRERDCDLRKWM